MCWEDDTPRRSEKLDVEDHYVAWRQTHDTPQHAYNGSDGPFSFCSYPFLLSPRAKSKLLHTEARFLMTQARRPRRPARCWRCRPCQRTHSAWAPQRVCAMCWLARASAYRWPSNKMKNQKAFYIH